MKKLNNKGFTVVEGILIFLALAIIGAVGWYVWQNNKSSDNSISTTQPVTQKPQKEKTVPLKTYTNEEYGFSFEYPETWQLKVDLKDEGRMANEGEVIVTSPNGTNVYFRPNQGGKGGDCWDDQANMRTTRTCMTRTIYTVSKLRSSTQKNPVYYYEASYKEPDRDGGETTYVIYIGNGEFAPTKAGSLVGAFITYWGEISAKGSVGIKVDGKDKSAQSSKDYFKSNEVKEAKSVLETFKLL